MIEKNKNNNIQWIRNLELPVQLVDINELDRPGTAYIKVKDYIYNNEIAGAEELIFYIYKQELLDKIKTLKIGDIVEIEYQIAPEKYLPENQKILFQKHILWSIEKSPIQIQINNENKKYKRFRTLSGYPKKINLKTISDKLSILTIVDVRPYNQEYCDEFITFKIINDLKLIETINNLPNNKKLNIVYHFQDIKNDNDNIVGVDYFLVKISTY